MFEPIGEQIKTKNSYRFGVNSSLGLKTSTYTIIFHDLLETLDLSLIQATLLTLIYDLSKKFGGCYLSQKNMAQKLRVDPSTINGIIRTLMERSLLERTKIEVKGRLITAYKVADKVSTTIEEFRKQFKKQFY